MIKPNPFTPKSGIEPRVFINRDKEIQFFTNKINEAEQGLCNHYVITGKWGCGKTTLLKYLKIVAQQQGVISAYFPVNEYNKLPSDNEIIIGLLQLIIQNLPIEIKKSGKLLSSIEGLGIQILGSGFNLTLKAKEDTILNPQILLESGLLSLWEDYSKETKAIVILMDDVQNFKNAGHIFTILKNVLSSDRILKTKYLFVLSSTITGWQDFMVRNHPIGRYFIPITELSNFDQNSTVKLIQATLKNSGVKFSESIINKIYQHTQGHLFETQAICNSFYDIQNNGKVESNDWHKGFNKTLQYIGTYVFSNMVHEASEQEKLTLSFLAKYDQPVNFETLVTQAKKKNAKIYGASLKRLVEKELIENPSRGFYFINDVFFREYILQIMK